MQNERKKNVEIETIFTITQFNEISFDTKI